MSEMSDVELVPCPCCSMPSLGERAGDEICPVCWWQDDGQDDPRADEVWGGPNHGYSLSEARRNFRDHGHMYRKGAGIDVVERPSEARRALLSYVRDVMAGKTKLDEQVFDALASDLDV